MGQKDDNAMTQEGFKKFRRRRSREQAAAEQSKFVRSADQRETSETTQTNPSANERDIASAPVPAELSPSAPNPPQTQSHTSEIRTSGKPASEHRLSETQEQTASANARPPQATAKAPPLQLDTPVFTDTDGPDGPADAKERVSRLRRRVKPAAPGTDPAEQTTKTSADHPARATGGASVENAASEAEAAGAIRAAVKSAPAKSDVSDAPKFDAKKVRVVKRRKTPEQIKTRDRSSVLPAKFDPWLQLPEVSFDFQGQRPSRLPLVSAFRTSPTARAFDLLRTRLIHSLKDHGWKRVAITSPSANGGTTFCAVNLALSLARVPGSRNILMDMNFRNPGVAAALGIPAVGNLGDFLAGRGALSEHLLRLSDSLAVATNSHADENASDIFHDSRTGDVVTGMIDDCRADTVLFDLPPVLEHDDVTAFLPQVDGVLLISDGEQTTAKQLASCEKMLAGHAPLLGVVLNRAQQTDKTQVTP